MELFFSFNCVFIITGDDPIIGDLNTAIDEKREGERMMKHENVCRVQIIIDN